MYRFLTIISAFAGCLAIFWTLAPNIGSYIGISSFNRKSESSDSSSIQQHNYSSITVSNDPLVVYISNFLSDYEISHILDVTTELFVPSRVYSPSSSSNRNSSSCVLPSSNPVHDLVVARSKAFLDKVIREYPEAGLSYFDFEKLQLVKYGPHEYYRTHVDWFDTLHKEEKGWKSRLYNRVASFFIYLDDQCVGGGTHFPEIDASTNSSQTALLEQFMDVNDKGVSFRPKKGNGIFWVNLKPNGLGDKRLIHAGLPLEAGRKIGMNIWVKRDFGW